MIVLKKFQQDTLDKLREYLDASRLSGDPAAAFLKVAKTPDGRLPVYRKVPDVPELGSIPYVCLRLPTGGGKTIVGAYSIRVAAQSYIEKDYPAVLWLVPSKSIQQQTAQALKNTAHPYRAALDAAFDGRVRVFEISEIENIRPQDLRDAVCVVVGTIQSLRVTSTEGRDVYAHKEALEDHFTRLNTSLPGLERIETGAGAGRVKYSFANLMMIHRPLLIMDEAHNARTSLTFDTLKRLSPSAIIELTATPSTDPRTGSNVLYRVSASELKAEEMIKLPILLTEHGGGWQEAVADACRTRKRLAELAAGEPEYIRPILLIQAENRDRPANVDAVKQFLLDSEHLAEEQIAVATGDQRGLDKIDLFDRVCKVEAVITVQALKEGWDCSFAYVFCSTANIGSSRDVEQLLGRVLRMPYAKRRKAAELNKAYAHVSSSAFGEAAKQLETCMVEKMGFEAAEAQQYIEPQQPSLPNLPLFLQRNPFRQTVAEPLKLDELSEREQQSIVVKSETPGRIEIEVHGPVTPQIEKAVLAAVPEPQRAAVRQKIQEHRAEQQAQLAPSQRGETLAVPRLCVRSEGKLLPFDDKNLMLDAASWDLSRCAADLSGFRFDDTSKTFEFDVVGGKVTMAYKGEQQLDLNLLPGEWTETDLIRWLDKELRQPDVRQEASLAWLRACVSRLLERKVFDLPLLVRAKFILARALAEMRDACRASAYKAGYQELLFGPNAAPETSFDYAFRYDPNIYPANWLYSGRNSFPKHFYPVVGELESSGEEFDCAVALDAQSGVKYWVRNLAKQPEASFWLQTSTDRFYPDFVAETLDGRLLVVEYKGKDYVTNDDSKEKKLLGAVWAKSSNGKAIFLMAVKKDERGRDVHKQIQETIMAARAY